MTTGSETTLGAQSEPGSDASREEIEQDIKRTRDSLGSTVEALTQRVDLRSRAKAKLGHTRSALTAEMRAHQPILAAAGVALILTIGGLIVWRAQR